MSSCSQFHCEISCFTDDLVWPSKAENAVVKVGRRMRVCVCGERSFDGMFEPWFQV